MLAIVPDTYPGVRRAFGPLARRVVSQVLFITHGHALAAIYEAVVLICRVATILIPCLEFFAILRTGFDVTEVVVSSRLR